MNATEVKHATQAEKAEMAEVIASLNEGDEWDCSYRLEKAHTSYVVVMTFDDGSEERGGMMRCEHCGHIRELFEGQIAFCTECGVDWPEWDDNRD